MKKTQYPLMSIVVLNWNGLKHTKVCLEHLRKLRYPSYEIIVVDNGSRKPEKDWLAKQKGIIYVNNPKNRGFTGGHIDGLVRASGEFIVLLNNDAVMQADYLNFALEDFKDPSVAVVGGRSYFWNDDAPLLNTDNPFYSYQNVHVTTGEGFMQETDFGVPQVVNNVSGSAVIMRRHVINEIGYLYDRFFAYFEETDLFARVKRAGYKVLYDPRLHIWHRNGASSGASSGSHFFYYQIFRNRFIFAMRNFEAGYMPRFLFNYTKITFGCLARMILRPHSKNRVMHRAYVKAAWYNLLRLFVSLASRHSLKKQLGKSTYNHQIYLEQTGVSLLFDCTKLADGRLKQLKSQLAADTNPLHEYVLVTKGGQDPGFDPAQTNLRFVSDRGYFETNPLNIGCLVARFDWMALCDTDAPPQPDDIDAAVKITLGIRERLIVFGNSTRLSPTVALLHKELFEKMGGLPTTGLKETIQYLAHYAMLAKSIAWMPASNMPVTALPQLTSAKKQTIINRIHHDNLLINAGHASLWDKFKNRYSRIGQVSMFGRWLVFPYVSLYLKAARLKNLVKFAVTLNRPAFALELRHIRNEVILNSARGIDIVTQNKHTKKQLKELQKNPTTIPVFIICRDRVDALKQLIAWLEKKGLKHIVFIDNDSVYPPLLEYLKHTPYQVLKLFRNVGHTSPWQLGIVRTLVPEDVYIVTDPDVIPVKQCPNDVLQHFLAVHQQHFIYQKVGFGLKIDDLPDYYPLKKSVIDWENQFWQKEIAPGVYEAGVDTTFAMYKPFTYRYVLHPSIRTGEPYVARHVPWYNDPAKITEEEAHYRYRANHNISSWNADELKDRYAKEMHKKK